LAGVVDVGSPGAYLSTSQIDQSISAVLAMREIQASEAKTHLPQLLDEVERGETLVITRHGRPIARIVPEPQQQQKEIENAIQGIKALRKRTGKLTLDEILSARHEGHKY
jgi:prevent-host-death family protein